MNYKFDINFEMVKIDFIKKVHNRLLQNLQNIEKESGIKKINDDNDFIFIFLGILLKNNFKIKLKYYDIMRL